MSNLTPNAVMSRALANQAAGQGTSDGDAVDMAGFTSITFLGNLTTVAGGGSATLSVQGRDDPADDWQDLTGSVSRSEAGIIALEVHAPMFRYVRPRLVRADANVTTGDLLTVQRLATDNPVESEGQTTAVLVSPEPA